MVRDNTKNGLTISFVRVNSGLLDQPAIKGTITRGMSSRDPAIINAGLATRELLQKPPRQPPEPTLFWGVSEKFPLIKIYTKRTLEEPPAPLQDDKKLKKEIP